MTVLTREVKQRVIRRTREILIENKWTRGRWVRASRDVRVRANAHGTGHLAAYEIGKKTQLIGANKDTTCSFCVQGAMYAAAATCGLTLKEACDLIEAAERTARESATVPVGLMGFNDDRCRTKREMIKTLEALEEVVE